MAKIEHARWKLKELLKQCQPSEIELFHRMYGPVETIASSDVNWAITQTTQSIKLREEKLTKLLLLEN